MNPQLRKLALEFMASAVTLGPEGERLLFMLPDRYVEDERLKEVLHKLQTKQPLMAGELMLLQDAKASAGNLERPEMYLDALLLGGFSDEVTKYSAEIQTHLRSGDLSTVRDLLSKPPLEINRDEGNDVGSILEANDTVTDNTIPLGSSLVGLETVWGPLMPTAVYTIAAPEGTGKSALAEQIMLETAFQGIGVVDFSVELAANVRAMRYMQHLYGADVGPRAFYGRKQLGSTYNETLANKAKAQLKGLPLYIEEGVENIHAILSRARHYMNTKNCKVFCVDFVQALSGDKSGEDPYTTITQAMRLLFAFARDSGATFLVTSQMNKEGVKSAYAGAPITNTALEGSSKIGQFSWVVSFIIRDPTTGGHILHTTKNRTGGSLGQTPMTYDGQHLTFSV
ncbi:MAG: DnaB-like helicase C-terminal domain-containing protein [Meiothermus sp.]|nr:DnaB-like helicase C-terminal domain-containing protein [Meiothermus sp.]